MLPITLLVLLLGLALTPVPLGTLTLFFSGAVLMVIGMGLFTLGADMAMMPIGEHMGAFLTKSRKLWLVIIGGFLLGLLITVAEPDLTVLAKQVPAIPDATIILTVSAGVGVFLVLSLLRIVFKIQLKTLLLLLYPIVFGFGALINPDFLAVAFDSGGVTTGPITVPFILAMGVGVANIRAGASSRDDSFGFVALCSVGPILAIMILSLFFPDAKSDAVIAAAQNPADTGELLSLFLAALPHYFGEVALALSPIVALFLVCQIFFLKLPFRALRPILVGVLYTYIGLSLFLAGVNVGFLPMGTHLGDMLARSDYRYLIVFIGMLMGYFVVKAEPAVHVLNEQVETITAGAISRGAMMKSLSIGVACAVGLAMLRVLTGLSIWWLIIPGYALALGLSFVTDPIFTAIAFDSGGVASGPMTATFILPFAMGACGAVGGDMLRDAFGVVAMVAMTPLVTIQILGLVYHVKSRKAAAPEGTDDEIIDV